MTNKNLQKRNKDTLNVYFYISFYRIIRINLLLMIFNLIIIFIFSLLYYMYVTLNKFTTGYIFNFYC